MHVFCDCDSHHNDRISLLQELDSLNPNLRRTLGFGSTFYNQGDTIFESSMIGIKRLRGSGSHLPFPHIVTKNEYTSAHQYCLVILDNRSIVLLYDLGQLAYYSCDLVQLWSMQVSATANLIAACPTGDKIILPMSNADCMVCRVSDGYLLSTLTSKRPDEDTRIVSLEWSYYILIAYANGFIELISDDERKSISCEFTIHSAQQSRDGSMVSAVTCDALHIYSTQSSRLIYKVNLTDSLDYIQHVSWIPSHGGHRLEIQTTSSLQKISMKDPKYVCSYDCGRVVAFADDRALSIIRESEHFRITCGSNIKSILGKPDKPFCVTSIVSQVGTLVRCLNAHGNTYAADHCFESNSYVRTCDYSSSKIACTNGIFAIILGLNGTKLNISIHSPTYGKCGIPPMDPDPPAESVDTIEDVAFGGEELIGIARKSGIVQVYGLDGEHVRLLRTVRASSEYSPCKLWFGSDVSIILDRGSKLSIGTSGFEDMSILGNRTACWKFVVSPDDSFVAVCDRDSVFLYRLTDNKIVKLVDTIRVGQETELVGLWDCEMILFNWEKKSVIRVPIRIVRDWELLAIPSTDSGELFSYVSENQAQRLWRELGTELVRRGDTRAIDCFVECEDWLATVLIDQVITGQYSREYALKVLKGQREMQGIEMQENVEYKVARGILCSDSAGSWKTFHEANVIILCESLLRTGEVDTLVAVLDQVTVNDRPRLRRFLEDTMISSLVFADAKRGALRLCIRSLDRIDKAIAIAHETGCWELLTMTVDECMDSSVDLTDEMLTTFAEILDEGMSIEGLRCVVSIAKRCTPRSAKRLVSLVHGNKQIPLSPLARQVCEVLLRKIENDAIRDKGSSNIALIVRIHRAMYASDFRLMSEEAVKLNADGLSSGDSTEYESNVCLLALGALMSKQRDLCSSAFRRLQTSPIIPEHRREIYTSMSFRIFGGQRASGNIAHTNGRVNL